MKVVAHPLVLKSTFLLPLLLATQVTGAQAHELKTIGLITRSPGVGDVVEIGIEFVPKPNVYVCGIQVDYGDGTNEFIRVEGPNPSGVLRHTYQSPGTAIVQIAGKDRIRGLKSVFACAGNGRSLPIVIAPDSYSVRQAKALQAAQAEANAARAEAERQRNIALQATQGARAAQATPPTAPTVPRPTTAPSAQAKPEKPTPKSALDL